MPEFNLNVYIRIPDDDDETLNDIRRRATNACEDAHEPVPNDVAGQYAAILNWGDLGDRGLPASVDGALVAEPMPGTVTDTRSTYTTECIRACDLKPGDVARTGNTSEAGKHFLAVTDVSHTTYGWVYVKLGTTSISVRENDLVYVQRVQSTTT